MSYQLTLSRNQADFYTLEAFSIGRRAWNTISTASKGHVHSIFPRALNILTASGELVSVVGNDVGRGPTNLVVDIPSYSGMTSLGIKKSQHVSIFRESILVPSIGEDPSLRISTKHAKQWKPRNDFKRDLVSYREINQNLDTVRITASSHGSHTGLGQFVDFTGKLSQEILPSINLNSFAIMALPHLLSLLNAIKRRDSQSIRDSSERLIGLGPGLTPSGDDLLAGLMISLNSFSQNLQRRSLELSRINNEIVSILQFSPQLTTFLSREYLIHAAGGELNESIMTLVEKIMTGKQMDVVSATIRVLSIGETSGTDTVLGILLGSALVLGEVGS